MVSEPSRKRMGMVVCAPTMADGSPCWNNMPGLAKPSSWVGLVIEMAAPPVAEMLPRIWVNWPATRPSELAFARTLRMMTRAEPAPVGTPVQLRPLEEAGAGVEGGRAGGRENLGRRMGRLPDRVSEVVFGSTV